MHLFGIPNNERLLVHLKKLISQSLNLMGLDVALDDIVRTSCKVSSTFPGITTGSPSEVPLTPIQRI